MESFTDKMFEFQRRATQAVLQKMGATETTVDEQFDNTHANFKRLGEFLTHLEESTQQSLTQMEKMCFSNSQLASSLCNFVLSELSSDDSEFSTGLLSKFFLKTSTNPNLTPAENNKEFNNRQSKFQDSVQRLYDSFGTIGHENMAATQDEINHKVVRPIKRDQEYNKVTKQLLEKRKKLNLDFDSIKRSSDVEKIRATKEEFDTLSKKTTAHLQNRSFVRCKLIVHSVITMVQQFCMFFESNAVLLDGLITFIEPLLSSYQLNTEQLSDIYTIKKTATNINNNNGTPLSSSPKQQSSNGNGSSNGNIPKPIPTTPPPTYKEFVDTHSTTPTTNNPNSRNNNNNNNNNNLNNSNNNVNINEEFNQKVSFQDRSSPSDSSLSFNSNNSNNNNNSPSASYQKPKEEKLFSVWDEDSKHDNDNENDINSGSNNSKSGNKSRDDEWMYHSSDNSVPNLSKSDSTWQEPLVPESNSKPTNYSSFNNTQQQPYYNSNSNNNSNNNNNNNRQYQPPNHQHQPQQNQQPSQPSQQQDQQPPPTKKSSGFENIFGDFDFTSPSPQRHGSSGSTTGNGNGNQPNYYSNSPQPPTQSSQHVDNSQHERSIIEPVVSEKIKMWGEKNGRKNNLRVLLSTLHDVLWIESGWEKVTYGSLVTPIQVKKVYRKAIIVVHPDKVHNGTHEQKVIAQRIFECLRESFEVFKVDLEPST